MGTYIRLVDINDAKGKESAFLSAAQHKNSSIRFETSAENFSKIPGSPVAYWVGKGIIACYQNSRLDSICTTREGITTANNEQFIRLWFEVSISKIGFNCSRIEALNSKKNWFPYAKGGESRKWYGNREYVVNWENDGFNIRNYKDVKTGRIRSHNYNLDYIFKPCLSWTRICSSGFTIRYYEKGFMCDTAGGGLFSQKDLLYILGYLSTVIVKTFLQIQNPTVVVQVGDVATLPIVVDIKNNKRTEELVIQNIEISTLDWDSLETSWDFKTHPLITHKSSGWIETSFRNWQEFADRQFYQLKANEEELNRIFIDIYGLQDELTPDVEEKDVTVRKADLGRDVRSFISYAVGCMLGRYSLDVEGLAYAGGDWDQSKYKTYIPDADNCIPITDEEYFDDDVVSRFVDFVKAVYGKDTLEKNLEFIAEALGNRGDTPLKTIRNYFINDFYKDHVKIYQKRPIYWLFDSGKENGFKALIYMHRYNADTIGNIRIEYIHKLQAKYESQLSFEQHLIDTSQNQREKSAAIKQKEKLIRQIKEIKDYDVKIAHLANCRIEIDLDDGVKVNYEKVQTGKDGKKLEVLGKI